MSVYVALFSFVELSHHSFICC